MKISHEDAATKIGLLRKDEKIYFLANLVIEVYAGKILKITEFPGKKVAHPQSSYETELFTYTNAGIEYLLKVEEGDLAIYEKS